MVCVGKSVGQEARTSKMIERRMPHSLAFRTALINFTVQFIVLSKTGKSIAVLDKELDPTKKMPQL